MDEAGVHLVVQAEIGQGGAQQEQRRPERHEAVWRRSAQRAHVHRAGSTRDPGHRARAAPGGSGGGRAAVHDPRSLAAGELQGGLATHGHSPAGCALPGTPLSFTQFWPGAPRPALARTHGKASTATPESEQESEEAGRGGRSSSLQTYKSGERVPERQLGAERTLAPSSRSDRARARGHQQQTPFRSPACPIQGPCAPGSPARRLGSPGVGRAGAGERGRSGRTDFPAPPAPAASHLRLSPPSPSLAQWLHSFLPGRSTNIYRVPTGCPALGQTPQGPREKNPNLPSSLGTRTWKWPKCSN